MHVKVFEECDGFEIKMIAFTDADMRTLGGPEKSWRFNQEDSIESLTEVFQMLGAKTTYEEVY